jgi:hypothetical protein
MELLSLLLGLGSQSRKTAFYRRGPKGSRVAAVRTATRKNRVATLRVGTPALGWQFCCVGVAVVLPPLNGGGFRGRQYNCRPNKCGFAPPAFCTAPRIQPPRLWQLKALEVVFYQRVAATALPRVALRLQGSVVQNPRPPALRGRRLEERRFPLGGERRRGNFRCRGCQNSERPRFPRTDRPGRGSVVQNPAVSRRGRSKQRRPPAVARAAAGFLRRSGFLLDSRQILAWLLGDHERMKGRKHEKGNRRRNCDPNCPIYIRPP